MDKISKLTEIANKHNADKGTVAYEKHGYTEEYSKYIPENGEFELLEIGIWHGDSLKMWAEYAPKAWIIGIDNDPGVLNYIKSAWNYEVLIGDAASAEFIQQVSDDIVSPDFIVDDGSHRYEDIVASFKLLYPKLKKGGYYFIEDLHAGQSKGHHAILDEIHGLYEWESVEMVCGNKLMIIHK